jgi:hypothetical protein
MDGESCALVSVSFEFNFLTRMAKKRTGQDRTGMKEGRDGTYYPTLQVRLSAGDGDSCCPFKLCGRSPPIVGVRVKGTDRLHHHSGTYVLRVPHSLSQFWCDAPPHAPT